MEVHFWSQRVQSVYEPRTSLSDLHNSTIFYTQAYCQYIESLSEDFSKR